MQRALSSLLMNLVNCNVPPAGHVFVIKPTHRAVTRFSAQHADIVNYAYFGPNPISSLFICVRSVGMNPAEK
jgi:hypothetical protein